jgi:hypothetical protein
VDALLDAGLNNAAWSAVLALVAAAGGRLWRRHPSVAHTLWLLVLLKLVTPSLVHVALPEAEAPARSIPGWAEPSRLSRPIAVLPARLDAIASDSESLG